MSVYSDLQIFYEGWTGEKGYIGTTENGVLIPYFAVKKSEYPIVIAQYAIHAREFITTYLAFMQAEEFNKSGSKGSVYFIPAVNIDGIEEAENFNGTYKANARRVDLNVNFDARWGKGAKNAFIRGDENFVGERPFSESETRALRDFTLKTMPDATISYHSKGEEIYWEFFQDKRARSRDYLIAKEISFLTGYPLKSAGRSVGGYKDWCIEKLGISSFTIEVGSDNLTHPIKKEHACEIFLKNKRVINAVTEILWKEKNGLC